MSDLFQPVHEDFRKSLREFIEKELTPNADAWEEAEDFPYEYFAKMGELGFLGMQYPEEFGGDDDILAEAVFHEEIPRCNSGGVAATLGAHMAIAMPQINKFGTPEQKKKYLIPGVKGESIGALGITEPGGGSDVAGITTYAVRDGSDWIINGSKTFITNGCKCDWVVVAAKTDRGKGYGGISQFLVDRGTPGFETSKKLKKLGWKASDTGELSFMDCRVPADALLGEENKGFFQIMANFVWERMTLALGSISGAELTMEETIAYAREREAFGQPISKFQVITHYFADMATQIEAARQLTYYALKLFMEGKNPVKEVSMAKLFACDMGCQVVDQCLQIFGGYGFMDEYPVSRSYRDMRLGPIGGGTREIMREIISKSMGL
jgi:acyl-CoA dehydrogenase